MNVRASAKPMPKAAFCACGAPFTSEFNATFDALRTHALQVVSGSEQHRPRPRGAPASSDPPRNDETQPPQGRKKETAYWGRQQREIVAHHACQCVVLRRATFQCEVDNNRVLSWARAWPISNDLEILGVKVISLICIATICIATAHDLDHRAEHDRQIEVEAPVVDIPYVELYPSLHGLGGRRLSARAIDLRATSGGRKGLTFVSFFRWQGVCF